MQPNIIPSIANLINNAENPVIILLVAHGCDISPTSIETEFEKILAEHEKPVVYYKWCVSESSMVFPRTQAPVAYFFLPKTQEIAFWRDVNILQTLSDDVDTIHKMMTGKSYDESRFSEDELKKIQEVEKSFEEESAEIDKYPSTFQMARNLAKELWESGKKAARGLPVIVSTEVGFHRLQTCEGCDKFEAESSRCTECGCFMKVKTQIASASCPLGKWNAV
jgi:hypothetical protein